jgi:dihydrofolate synthase / folylpolyglutamate synthase
MSERLSFEDACRFLFARQGSRIKWSLGPTQGLLDLLGHPERHFPAVHIGGTNGKGSTSAFTATELAARGFRVGVYTSPHLVSVRERVVVDGVPIGEDAFAEWTSFLKPHIERLDASFFEATTAIAFADLAARGVDIAVVEVGLGGRLDSTNVITPLVSVVTKIALEHTDYLGADLASIAREKAGIAKPGVPFVTGERDPAVQRVLREEAERRGASRVWLAGTQGAATRPLGLKGVHQHANAWVALAALNQLPPPFGPVGDCWPESFEHAYVAGRFEVRGPWIFDVAHNPDGMEVLVTTLRAHEPPRPLHALVGIRNDKQWRAMLASLAPAVDRLILTIAPSVAPERRWLLEEVAQWSRARPEPRGRPDVVWEPDFARALDAVQEGAETMLVTGSFHTVGDALARLPGFAPVA